MGRLCQSVPGKDDVVAIHDQTGLTGRADGDLFIDTAVFRCVIHGPLVEEIPCEGNNLDQPWTYLYEAVANGKEYPITSEEALMVMKVLTESKK